MKGFIEVTTGGGRQITINVRSIVSVTDGAKTKILLLTQSEGKNDTIFTVQSYSQVIKLIQGAE